MTRVAFVMVALAGLPFGCQRADAPAAAPVPVPLPKSSSTNRLCRQMPDGRFREEVSAHLGLGKATRMESIEISWPDGSRAIFDKGYSVDQRLEVRKGEGRPPVSFRASRGNEK